MSEHTPMTDAEIDDKLRIGDSLGGRQAYIDAKTAERALTDLRACRALLTRWRDYATLPEHDFYAAHGEWLGADNCHATRVVLLLAAATNALLGDEP